MLIEQCFQVNCASKMQFFLICRHAEKLLSCKQFLICKNVEIRINSITILFNVVLLSDVISGELPPEKMLTADVSISISSVIPYRPSALIDI